MTGIEPIGQPSSLPQWAPGPPGPVEPAPARRRLWRPASALLCFGAALLTLLGSFLDLFAGRYLIGGDTEFAITITSWELWVETDSRSGVVDGAVPVNGVPLLFAAVVLLGAALLGVVATASPASVGIVRASVLSTALGAAFLLGSV